MSLLMDALRKAEESKKKAASKAPVESGQSTDPVAPAARGGLTSAAATASPPVSTPAPAPGPSAAPSQAPVSAPEPAATAAGNTATSPAVSPEIKTPRRTIPDLPMEFDESPADSAAAGRSSALDTAEQGIAFSGEDSGAESVSAKADSPREQDSRALNDAAQAETGAGRSDASTALTATASSPGSRGSEAGSSGLQLTPKESTEIRSPLDTGAAPDDSAVRQPAASSAPVATSAADSRRSGPKLELEVEAPELPAVRKKSARTTAGGGQAQTGSSIRERSAGARASARSVFAAKKPQQKRRQFYLIAGGGLAVVLLLGIGVVYFLASGSDSGISVPDSYVANRDFSEADSQFESSFDDNDAASADDFDAVDTAGQAEFQAEPGPQPATAADSAGAAAAAATPMIIPPLEVPTRVAEVGVDNAPATAPASASDSANVSPVTELRAEQDPAAAARDGSANARSDSDTETAPALAADASASPEQAAAATATISFSRRQPESTAEPQLNQAYAAFQQGDFAQARRLYEAVLASQPLHRDALLGLAAIAVENGQSGQAMEYYSRLLARNPGDPVARTALLELSPAGGPAVQERELRRLQERHPGVAPLAYALGNFYATREQWTDAQQHYFRALQLAKASARQPSEVNPDYAFNLAVSLEHLGQGRAALSFYREALQQSELFPASFDTALVRDRIESLSRTLSL